MTGVYVLDAAVDTIDGVPVGRLVYRFERALARERPDAAALNRKLEREHIEPYRRYWLGLEDTKPQLVRIDWGRRGFGTVVMRWQRNRVSWTEGTPLRVIALIERQRLQFLTRPAGGSRRVTQLAKKLHLERTKKALARASAITLLTESV